LLAIFGFGICDLTVTRLSQAENSGVKMGFEIERKFLLRSNSWRNSAIRHTKIRQAYLDLNAKVSIRVRIKDDGNATLTLKSRSSKLRRREFEYAIPTSDAEELILLRRGHMNTAPLAQRANTRCPVWVKSGHRIGVH
jgi:hypothetical protein